MFSQLHVLYLIQAIRLLSSAGFLAIIFFQYDESALAVYFLGVAQIQLLFLIFGVFSTPYFVARFVASSMMARRFAPREFLLNLASWCVILLLAFVFAQQYVWLVVLFAPMVFTRVCDDVSKASDGFGVFLTANLLSASLVAVLKIGAVLLTVDVDWLLLFVYFEEVLRSVFYLSLRRYWYILRRRPLNMRRLLYLQKVVFRTFSHGLASFLSGANYRVLFLTLGAHAPDSSVAIAGYFYRVFDIANGLIVQFAIYRFNRDRPTSANLEMVMYPIYRFAGRILAVAVVFFLVVMVLRVGMPMPYRDLVLFAATPACVAVSILNMNRTIIFNILKQPFKMLFSAAAASVVTVAVWAVAPYSGLKLDQYIVLFIVLMVCQSALFDAFFLPGLRHARLLRQMLGESLGRKKESL